MSLNFANCMFNRTHVVYNMWIIIVNIINYISNTHIIHQTVNIRYSTTTKYITYKYLYIPVLRRQRLDHSFGLSGVSRHAVCHHSGETIRNCHRGETLRSKKRISTKTPSIRWIALISWTVVKTSTKNAEALGLTANLVNRLSTHERVKW